MLVFNCLPQIGIECAFRDIAVNMDFLVSVSLTDDTSAALLQITRPPRAVEVMERDEPVLDVHSGPHLKRTSHEDAHLSGTHLAEQLFLTNLGVRFVDEGDLFTRDAHSDQLAANIVVDRKRSVRFHAVFGQLRLQCAKLRTVKRLALCLGRGRLWRGQVTKDELGELVCLPFLPDTENVIYTPVHLAAWVVRKVGVDDALVKPELSSIRRNFQHIVLCRVHLAAVNLCRTFGQLLHHALLHLCRLRNLRVVDRCWGRKVKLVSSLDVRCFFEQVHQFGQIEKLRKARPCPVTRSLGVEFVKILFVDFLN